MVSGKSIEQAIGLTILALIVVGAFLVLKPFLSAIVWAAVLCCSTWPLFVRLKHQFGGREVLAASIMISLVICLVLIPLAALAWNMTDEVFRLTSILRGWVEQGVPSLPKWLADIPVLGNLLLRRWNDFFQKEDLIQNLSPYIGTLRTQLLAVATIVANALLELILSLVIAFFLYCNGPELASAVDSIGVKLTGQRGHYLISIVTGAVRGVVEGLLAANLLQAILGAFGFWVAGIPNAILLGFFVFFLTVIPLGSGLVWIPAAIWLANSSGTGSAVLLAGWCILIFPVLETVVRPYLMKRGSTLSTLLVFFGMLGGMSAFGFIGIFLGPALLALIHTLLNDWRESIRKTGARNYESVKSSANSAR
jgi:predicted PurR-regulated permease PerM